MSANLIIFFFFGCKSLKGKLKTALNIAAYENGKGRLTKVCILVTQMTFGSIAKGDFISST